MTVRTRPISVSLRGIISQQLIPRIDDQGRVLALETLTNTPAVANIIREAKTFMLPGIMQTGGKMGMRLMDDSLYDLWSNGLISPEEAYMRCDQKQKRSPQPPDLDLPPVGRHETRTRRAASVPDFRAWSTR